MKNFNLIILTFIFMAFESCFPTKTVTTLPRVIPNFQYTPPSQAKVASQHIIIALIDPTYVSANPEYLISPFSDMSSSMGKDFEELLTSKGFTIIGPLSLGNMTYNQKMTTSFILEVHIGLTTQTTMKLISHDTFNVAGLLSRNTQMLNNQYTTTGTITFGGKIELDALSPQFNEKLWVKNIEIGQQIFDYTGSHMWSNAPTLAQQLSYDTSFYNAFCNMLQKVYNSTFEMLWNQIDPAEMRDIYKQAKEADKNNKSIYIK